MRKFLFLEYNEPGMEWLTKTENPLITLISAETPEVALERWISNGSRYCNEDQVIDQVYDMQDRDIVLNIKTLQHSWGVKIRMFEVKEDLSSLPWSWMLKKGVAVTQPVVGATED